MQLPDFPDPPREMAKNPEFMDFYNALRAWAVALVGELDSNDQRVRKGVGSVGPWNITNVTDNYELDGGAAHTGQVRSALATLLRDLKNSGRIG